MTEKNNNQKLLATALQELKIRSEEEFDAFLYDCDGTLAVNMQAHKDTYVEIAARQGVHIDPSIIDECAGFPIPEVVLEINKRYGSSFDPFVFEKAKSELFYHEFIEHTRPVQYVVDHLLAHVGKKKIGVVSGGSRLMVKKTLEVLGIAERIEVLVCAEDTLKGKPHPDPFLLASTELGVMPQKCLVFEDGDPGTLAAELAGMNLVRVDRLF